MKTISITIISIILSINTASTQSINWKSQADTEHHIIYANLGYDFGFTTKLGFGKQLNTFRPILVSTDISVPMGNDLLDDFKVRVGAQMALLTKSNFMLSASCYGVFRKQETRLVRQVAFGSEFSTVAGYYKPNWHLAVEIGYDKSVITHLKQSDLMRDNYPAIQDAWFLDAGGQIFYGIQASRRIGNKLDFQIKLGATNAQGDHYDALIPAYFRLGVSYRFLRGSD